MQEKPKKKRGFAPLLVVLALVVALAAVAAVTVLGEVKGGAPGADVTVSVAQGSGVASISKQLADAGVIRFPQVFRLYVKQSGKASQLQYGDFTLHKGMGYDALIDALSQYAAADTVTLTFPEGTPALGIAQAMEVSKYHLDRVFLATAGCTPVQYITRRRLAHAQTLLASTRQTVRHIAEQCGYTNYSYFTSLFRRTVGITPREYRKIAQGNMPRHNT